MKIIKLLLKPYEFTVTLFYILAVVALYVMWTNNDMMWLLAVPLMGWFNHFWFSLNHRLVAHRSFKARNKFVHKLIIAMGIFQVSHSPMRFAMFHRHHHSNTDIPGVDIHGPTTSLWESVVGWEYNLEETFKTRNIKIPKDLMRDETIVWMDKHFYKLLALASVITCLISWKLFLYVFVLGSVWFRLTASYFSNYHTSYFGYTNYDLGRDQSKNSVLANIFTFGEGWHNNHHAQPGNWKYGQKWWEWDPPQFAIRHLLGEKK